MDKLPTIEALLTGLAGTSAMTLFSYLTDRYRQENLQIPVLLGGLLKDTLPQEYQHCAKPAGWTAHYTIGIGWSWVFKVLYRNAIIPPTIKNGFVTGLFSGVIGIGLWAVFFKLHPRPPHTHLKAFFIQLLLAHVVYGTVVTLAVRKNIGVKRLRVRLPIL